MALCIIDFEATGLNVDNDEIIEVALKIFNEDKSYTALVTPKRGAGGAYVTPFITELTTITNEMIHYQGISQKIACNNMLEFIRANNVKYLMAHNGFMFDFPMLKNLLRRFNKRVNIKYIDSLCFIKNFLKLESYSQKNLCKKFNIIQENAHRAMGDVTDLESLMNQILLYYGDAINKEQITNEDIYACMSNYREKLRKETKNISNTLDNFKIKSDTVIEFRNNSFKEQRFIDDWVELNDDYGIVKTIHKGSRVITITKKNKRIKV